MHLDKPDTGRTSAEKPLVRLPDIAEDLDRAFETPLLQEHDLYLHEEDVSIYPFFFKEWTESKHPLERNVRDRVLREPDVFKVYQIPEGLVSLLLRNHRRVGGDSEIVFNSDSITEFQKNHPLTTEVDRTLARQQTQEVLQALSDKGILEPGHDFSFHHPFLSLFVGLVGTRDAGVLRIENEDEVKLEHLLCVLLARDDDDPEDGHRLTLEYLVVLFRFGYFKLVHRLVHAFSPRLDLSPSYWDQYSQSASERERLRHMKERRIPDRWAFRMGKEGWLEHCLGHTYTSHDSFMQKTMQVIANRAFAVPRGDFTVHLKRMVENCAFLKSYLRVPFETIVIHGETLQTEVATWEKQVTKSSPSQTFMWGQTDTVLYLASMLHLSWKETEEVEENSEEELLGTKTKRALKQNRDRIFHSLVEALKRISRPPDRVLPPEERLGGGNQNIKCSVGGGSADQFAWVTLQSIKSVLGETVFAEGSPFLVPYVLEVCTLANQESYPYPAGRVFTEDLTQLSRVLFGEGGKRVIQDERGPDALRQIMEHILVEMKDWLSARSWGGKRFEHLIDPLGLCEHPFFTGTKLPITKKMAEGNPLWDLYYYLVYQQEEMQYLEADSREAILKSKIAKLVNHRFTSLVDQLIPNSSATISAQRLDTVVHSVPLLDRFLEYIEGGIEEWYAILLDRYENQRYTPFEESVNGTLAKAHGPEHAAAALVPLLYQIPDAYFLLQTCDTNVFFLVDQAMMALEPLFSQLPGLFLGKAHVFCKGNESRIRALCSTDQVKKVILWVPLFFCFTNDLVFLSHALEVQFPAFGEEPKSNWERDQPGFQYHFMTRLLGVLNKLLRLSEEERRDLSSVMEHPNATSLFRTDSDLQKKEGGPALDPLKRLWYPAYSNNMFQTDQSDSPRELSPFLAQQANLADALDTSHQLRRLASGQTFLCAPTLFGWQSLDDVTRSVFRSNENSYRDKKLLKMQDRFKIPKSVELNEQDYLIVYQSPGSSKRIVEVLKEELQSNMDRWLNQRGIRDSLELECLLYTFRKNKIGVQWIPYGDLWSVKRPDSPLVETDLTKGEKRRNSDDSPLVETGLEKGEKRRKKTEETIPPPSSQQPSRTLSLSSSLPTKSSGYAVSTAKGAFGYLYAVLQSPQELFPASQKNFVEKRGKVTDDGIRWAIRELRYHLERPDGRGVRILHRTSPEDLFKKNSDGKEIHIMEAETILVIDKMADDRRWYCLWMNTRSRMMCVGGIPNGNEEVGRTLLQKWFRDLGLPNPVEEAQKYRYSKQYRSIICTPFQESGLDSLFAAVAWAKKIFGNEEVTARKKIEMVGLFEKAQQQVGDAL